MGRRRRRLVVIDRYPFSSRGQLAAIHCWLLSDRSRALISANGICPVVTTERLWLIGITPGGRSITRSLRAILGINKEGWSNGNDGSSGGSQGIDRRPRAGIRDSVPSRCRVISALG